MSFASTSTLSALASSSLLPWRPPTVSKEDERHNPDASILEQEITRNMYTIGWYEHSPPARLRRCKVETRLQSVAMRKGEKERNSRCPSQ
eukprot:1161082-Pelagomonas_calceolata.AAC.11